MSGPDHERRYHGPKAGLDPLIGRSYLDELAAAYFHSASPRNPGASPIFADLHGLPPRLNQVGSAETLLSNALMLAAKAGEADVPVTLQIWPAMIHAWNLFHLRLAAGQDALAAVGSFVRA